MTPRRRYLETLLFGRPDRVPFQPGGPRESTLAGWRTQGLPADGDWRGALWRALGLEADPAPRAPMDVGASFLMIPPFEEKVLERRQSHLVVQDWKGNICEIADRYDASYLRQAKDFVTRRWLRCPVASEADWEAMKPRYALDAPGRFADDFAERCRRLRDRDHVLTVAFNGPFWQMREWCGLEGLCLLMADRPDFVAEMAGFWMEFASAVLARVLDHVAPDAVALSEDMAYKGHPMISPAMTRRFLQPCYDRWGAQAKAAGVPLLDMDSDGCVEDLLPVWIESGINVCDPVEAAAHNDLPALRRRFGRAMAYRGGVDKRAIARGAAALHDELERLEPVVRDGGYIPGCDHGVPPDISWPNFVAYARLLARMTGWR